MDAGAVQEERQGADAEFRPNLVNTVCFIVQNAMQLITFAVNYIGEPFQTPLLENSGITSLRLSSLALMFVASGIVPQATEYVQLVNMPADIRAELFGGCFVVALSTWYSERWLRDLFPATTPPRKGYMSHLQHLPQKCKLV
jgi:manganese-transporting P-type ATPase